MDVSEQKRGVSGKDSARLCVSALSGGGGKTLLALGLARLLRRKGLAVKPFKKGPDYIDAAWLSLAAEAPAVNLDPWFLPQDRLRALFAHSMSQRHAGEGLGLIEGNRGLFDGLDVAGSCSTSQLARALACPVLVCLNCAKMTRTAAALVQGVRNFEPGLRIAGLVLNQVGSSRHETALRRALEAHTDVPVLGALPRLPENPLPERHMGLSSFGSGLSGNAQAVCENLADVVAAHVDVEAVLETARSAPGLPEEKPFWGQAPSVSLGEVPRIGYVHDDALWFYYQENLESLSRAGAELTRLSFFDGRPWPRLDGLYLGGGFPEDMAAQLSASPRLAEVADMARRGMPIYAECGGFMLLSRGIEINGRLWPMGGLFPVATRFCARPQGLGYVLARVERENPWFERGMELRGHEFHYSRCEWEAEAPPAALRLVRGTGMGNAGEDAFDGLVRDNVFAAYTHIFAPAVPCWALNFTRLALRFRQSG
ncbi:MAG: cobyrinate a,c-diamide synthase [Desulfovibrio sp.]|jgi:cobyrinic acid a,c-diamide synthase|nr:cobyrinate a,c-diamide synthase [Desulfovibrio sp.]